MTDGEREEAIVACERLIASMQRVIDVFSSERGLADRLLGILQGAESLTETLTSFDFSGERTVLTEALDEFETARRESRVAAWSLMAAEGTSIGEMGRIFGLSRQLISRQLKEHAASQDDGVTTE